MAHPFEIDGSKFIKIRVSKKFYEFIKELSVRMNIPISEICRSSLEISFMAMYLGDVKRIEKSFYEKYYKPWLRLHNRKRKK